MPVPGGSPTAVAPRAVFRLLALVCTGGALLVWVGAREGSPVAAAITALVAQGALCFQISRLPLTSRLRAVATVVAAGLVAPLGYYFGPNSAFAAPLALLLALTGLLSTDQSPLRRRTGLAVMIAVCAGQLAVVVAVAYDVLADVSLSPVKRYGVEPWRNISPHLILQGVFVVAYLIGRAAQRGYRRLVTETLEATRQAAIREVLLDEARADYERALAVRDAPEPAGTVRAPATAPDAPAADPPPTDEVPTQLVVEARRPRSPSRTAATRGSTLVDDGALARWLGELHQKLRGQDVFVLGACIGGGLLAGSSVKNALPRQLALASLAGITALIALRMVLERRRPGSLVTWPYPLVALLSAGGAYGFGPHAGFAAVVALVLFTGRLFRSPATRLRRDLSNPLSLVAVCVGHAAVFAAIMAGALPDASNLPVALPGMLAHEPYLNHLTVQGLYVAAFALGARIDREFGRAFDKARDAVLAAARAGAQLELARSELDEVVRAALSQEGLFSGATLGAYRVGRSLGRGGMGEVYEAERDGARVALKVVRPDQLHDPHVLEQFEEEARVLLRIESPYCARVVEVAHDQGLPYLAMEYVPGPSLSEVLRERGRLERPELIALVDDLGRGLADVHRAGVIHLDLKPSNVLRDGRTWKLVDFGVAAVQRGEARRWILGTPTYMAPEQALGRPLDPRADLYSLALILYRAITGRPAYVGSDAAAIAREAHDPGPPDPRRFATVPDDLGLALRIGLAADVADRFADAGELRAVFLAALGGSLDRRTRERGQLLVARAPWA